DLLRGLLPAGWVVRSQMPVALDEESEPEPDLAVIRGTRAELWAAHPTLPALVVEVADTSLAFDRDVKGSLYARAGIADFWIVNLLDRVVEVRRDPAADATARYGWRYGTVAVHGPLASIALLALPEVRVPVRSLLP
ncbi:MAG TPA: Uma2 family endonuclease, partial [Methylomirabilota bacterium]|nr:Uma2 family endonuclease [Methylomirabilota bacterium]